MKIPPFLLNKIISKQFRPYLQNNEVIGCMPQFDALLTVFGIHLAIFITPPGRPYPYELLTNFEIID